MATRNSELSFRLTGDPSSLLASLVQSRAALLRTYGAMKEGVEGARASWAAAQERVKGLSDSMGAMGPPTRAQVVELQKAVTAAGKLKDAYIQARDAAQAQQGKLRDNASAASQARQAVESQKAAAAVTVEAAARSIAAKRAEIAEELRLAAIVSATRAKMAAAAQEQLQVERQVAAEAAAGARRQAEAQAASAEWARRYAAMRLAAEDRVNANARRMSAQSAALGGPSNPNITATRAGLTSISTQLAQFRNLGAALVGAQGLSDLVRLVDGYTAFNARLKLASRSTQELEQAQRGLFGIAQRNGVVLGEAAQLFTRIAEPIRAMGGATTDALGVIDGVSQALRLSGASAAESSAAMLQFSQALGAGQLQGEELNSILENAPRLARALADGLGVPIGKLKELGAAGSLTSEKVLSAFRSQLPQLAREAAQMPLTIGQAVVQVQNAFQAFVGGADQASGASRKIAESLSWVASNIGTVVKVVAGLATTLGASFLIRSIAGLAAAVGGVPAALVVAAGVGVTTWLSMGDGAKKAGAAVKGSLADMAAEAVKFGANWDEATRDVAMAAIIEKVKEAQKQLKEMKLEDAMGAPGKKLEADIAAATKAVATLEARKAELATKNLTKEKKDLGLDGLKADGLNLIDKEKADQLTAFDRLYKAFVKNARDSSGGLVTSYGQVRAAIDNLIAGAKTPAEFDGLIARLTKALKGTVGGGTAPLRAELASLMEARAQAEEKALAGQVSGLQARVDRANKYFAAMASQAKLAMEVGSGMARVQAELKEDTRALSADQVAQAQAAAAAAQHAADVQVALLERVAARKKAIIEADRVAASRAATDAGIDAARAAESRLRILAAESGAVAPDSARAREIAAEEKRIADDLAKEKKRIAEAAADAQAGAARRVADVERATAQQRLEILRTAQGEIASKASEALAGYKNYAQQVIALDRQIVANRLDTARSIEGIKRQDMTPAQQVESMRAEMQRLKDAAREAEQDGDKPRQQDALNRQKSVATELANAQGDGVDQKAIRQEAIDNLRRVGDESDSLLKAQRDEAKAAADEQKATYEALVANLQRLSAEIGKINQGEAIKLKAEIDMTSVQDSIAAVQAAFSKATFAVRVAATGLPASGGGIDAERRAAGGLMTGPGHDTSDNILTLTSPGEFVVRAAAVRHYGADTLASINRMRLPRFAQGGMVGGLAIPAPIVREASPAALQPVNITMPGGQTYPMQAAPDVAAAMDAHIRTQVLKRGRF